MVKGWTLISDACGQYWQCLSWMQVMGQSSKAHLLCFALWVVNTSVLPPHPMGLLCKRNSMYDKGLLFVSEYTVFRNNVMIWVA